MSLSPPDATYSDDLYRFYWPDLGVECLLERFNERRDDIQTELTVTLEHATIGGRLYSGRLLLMGPNSRRDVERALMARTEDYDWGGLLEQVCQQARERFRKGEPILDLWGVTRGERPQFLLEPFVLDNAISILYGDGATAKSSLALWWGVEVSLNYGPVLYLDWEDDAATHAERLRAIARARHVEDIGAGVLYQRRFARIADSVRELRRAVAEHGVRMVVVDSLGMAAGDPNDSNLMIEAMRACRALGVAVLAIHHLPKNSPDKSKPFGTVYASNEARLTWLVEKSQEEDTPEFSILLTNHKTNRSRLFGKRALRVLFDNGEGGELYKLQVSDMDATKVANFRPKLALWKHIEAVLTRPMTVAEVKGMLELDERTVSEASVRRALNENRSRFTNVGSSQAAVWSKVEQRTEAYASVRGSER